MDDPRRAHEGWRADEVPLAPLARQLLAAVPRTDGVPYVFSTRQGKPLKHWSNAVLRASARSGVSGWSAHDVRRSARTGFAKIGIPADVAERLLAHALQGVRRNYDHHTYFREKRDALDRWATHLSDAIGASDLDSRDILEEIGARLDT